MPLQQVSPLPLLHDIIVSTFIFLYLPPVNILVYVGVFSNTSQQTAQFYLQMIASIQNFDQTCRFEEA